MFPRDGHPPPTPSWGRDPFGTATNYAQLAPWIPQAPGIAVSLVVFGFNLLGDAVCDLLHPACRGGHSPYASRRRRPVR
ncbi:MAG: hypothetical protein NZ951_02420 [Dehalococcoidia bacterium]|nr:hypothetical protein [Dehalococcoidia bacterium]MDW8119815.1 hypothetical protein [Chloroflexota bacterium]